MITASDVASYREVTKGNGIIGDATLANEEKGKAYHEAMIRNIADITHCEDHMEVNIRNQQILL